MLGDSIYPVVSLRLTAKPGHISAGWLLAIYVSTGNDVLGGLCKAPGVLSEVTVCQSHLSLSFCFSPERGHFVVRKISLPSCFLRGFITTVRHSLPWRIRFLSNNTPMPFEAVTIGTLAQKSMCAQRILEATWPATCQDPPIIRHTWFHSAVKVWKERCFWELVKRRALQGHTTIAFPAESTFSDDCSLLPVCIKTGT